MSRKFEIVIFTSARQDYAERMISILDPQNTIIKYALFRQSCVPYKGICMKDFGVIANRNIQDMIMVDNMIFSFALNLENGVPIKPYFGGKDDRELSYLAGVLDTLQNYEDVRTFISNNFRLNSFYSYLRGFNSQY